MNETVLNRIKYLVEILNKWNAEYYIDDKPTVSDKEYDEALLELKLLEKSNPDLIQDNSPTQRVGGYVDNLFQKHNHLYPMLSLDNAFNEDDIEKFFSDLKKNLGEKKINFVIENKIDGLSISLVFSKGILVKAITRGDGKTGEDVTANVVKIKSIPKFINNKDEYFEVRGEIFVSKEQFQKINNELFEQGQDIMANSRNLASGTIRQLDQKIVESRGLDAIFYFSPTIDYKFNQDEVISTISSLGFRTQKDYKIFETLEQINHYIKNFDKDKLEYDIDGLVIKLNQRKYYEEAGQTSKFPKWAIAYKFPAEMVTTKLKDIFATVGRTRKITYNAVLEPVVINKTTVSAATLHNAQYITSRDIRINDTVYVYKAGEIIPRVVESLKNDEHFQNNKWLPHENCPSCKTELKWTDNMLNQYCQNKECYDVKLQYLENFVSRDSMNIEGLADKTLKKFIDSKIISKPSDIYTIPTRQSEIMSVKTLEKRDDYKAVRGFKDKSFKNLCDSIENSKNNSLERVLTALGIENIGKKAALVLAKKFLNIDNLIKANYDSLREMRDFGEISIKSIIEYFSNSDNIEEINKLKSLGINFEYKGKITKIIDTKFYSKNIAITGNFLKWKRNYLTEIFTNSFNAKVSENVTSKTDYLICGSDAGSKLKKAIDNNIEIIKEEELNKYMEMAV